MRSSCQMGKGSLSHAARTSALASGPHSVPRAVLFININSRRSASIVFPTTTPLGISQFISELAQNN